MAWERVYFTGHCMRITISTVTTTMGQTVSFLLVLLLFVNGAEAQSTGLSGLTIGLIVAAVVIILIVIAVGICFFVYKRKHLGSLEFEHPEFERTGVPLYASASQKAVPEPKLYNTESEASATDGPTTASEGDAASTDDAALSPGKAERKERFTEQLLELEPHAGTLHEMLQDVQGRLKTAKHGNPRVNGYKAVSRDLSRVQHLVGKRNSSALKMPPDGVELLAWATEAKAKYQQLQQYKSNRDSGILSDPPEMATIMWIQSKEDSAFEDKSFEESPII